MGWGWKAMRGKDDVREQQLLTELGRLTGTPPANWNPSPGPWVLLAKREASGPRGQAEALIFSHNQWTQEPALPVRCLRSH